MNGREALPQFGLRGLDEAEHQGRVNRARPVVSILRGTFAVIHEHVTAVKLAKREAKRTRRTAKEAKRAFIEASSASEATARELARLETKIQKTRKKSTRPIQAKERKQVFARKAVQTKSRSQPAKPMPAKPTPKSGIRAKPATVTQSKSAQPSDPLRESIIQVPRDFDAKPALAATRSSPKSSASTPLGENSGS